jgi:hypothetical protein
MRREKEHYAWHLFYGRGTGTVLLLVSGIVMPHDSDGGQLQSSTQILTQSEYNVKQFYRHELAVPMQIMGDSDP